MSFAPYILVRPILAAFGIGALAPLVLVPLIVRIAVARMARRKEVRADVAAVRPGRSHLCAGAERIHQAIKCRRHARKMVHPNSYDRMLAAGVTPDFARPAKPGESDGRPWSCLSWPRRPRAGAHALADRAQQPAREAQPAGSFPPTRRGPGPRRSGEPGRRAGDYNMAIRLARRMTATTRIARGEAGGGAIQGAMADYERRSDWTRPTPRPFRTGRPRMWPATSRPRWTTTNESSPSTRKRSMRTSGACCPATPRPPRGHLGAGASGRGLGRRVAQDGGPLSHGGDSGGGFSSSGDHGSAKTIREQRCEAFYYVGMTHLLGHDPVALGASLPGASRPANSTITNFSWPALSSSAWTGTRLAGRTGRRKSPGCRQGFAREASRVLARCPLLELGVAQASVVVEGDGPVDVAGSHQQADRRFLRLIVALRSSGS